VIRTARQRAGGLLTEWQAALDAKNLSALVAFAAKPDVVELGPELLCALGRDLETRPDAVLALLRRAAERYPGHVWINYDLAHAYATATPPRRAEALRYASVAAAARPNSAVLQVRLAEAFSNQGAHFEAAAAYRKALAISPRSAAARNGLINALEAAGDRAGVAAVRDETIQNILAAIRREPNNASLQGSLGSVLYTSGDLKGAIAAYREAARIEPDRPTWHDWIAFLLLQSNDPIAAVSEAREAVRLDPKNVAAKRTLGRALEATGDLDGAIQTFEQALRFAPNDAWTKNALAVVRQKKLARDKSEDRIAPAPREVKRP
jgi:tetratricopeptide (TPR) repeat protein